MSTLETFAGGYALLGPSIDKMVQTALSVKQGLLNEMHVPTSSGYHITIVTKHEMRSLSPEQRQEISFVIPDTQHLFSAGVGGRLHTEVYWVVVIWNAGQQIRKRLGLPPKHFHVTISSNNLHEVDKGVVSLFPGQYPSSPSSVLLDHTTITLHTFGQHGMALEYGLQLILLDPTLAKGFLRAGDTWLIEAHYKLAMLAYACVYQRSHEPKTKNYCLKRLVECSEYTEWGTVFQEHEIGQLRNVKDISPLLLAPWSVELRDAVSDLKLSPRLLLEPRTSLFVPSRLSGEITFYKLPQYFRWLIPFYLAIMSTPRNEDDISTLAASHLGIRHVLTLTEEEPLREAWFLGKHISNTFLPIPNFHPPSIEQMDLVIRLFDEPKRLPLLVHCGGGKGRAGTVAACYLAAFGFQKAIPGQDHPAMSAQESVSHLRSLRPGSIETAQQEAFVSKWCSAIWKRQSVCPDVPSEPAPCPMEIVGTLPKQCDLVMLVGLPGSGKSWFCNSLIARDPSNWHRISQDDSGSRDSCETEIGRAPKGKQVLLDRCNTSEADRKVWLSLAGNWCLSPICVWFDYERELCTARAQMRAGHPTLPPGGRVRNAVEQMQKIFARPTLDEGFKAIIVVRSFAAAEEAILRLSAPILIHKFPRTPHLIDVGAATSDDVHVDAAFFASAGGTAVITEKIDGANMGFSLSSDRTRILVQNRSHYVSPATHAQFAKLGVWIERHADDLRRVLDRDACFAERYILYGEWMYATHSIAYAALPDYFIAFDLFDRTTRSWADTRTLRRLLDDTAISAVPVMYEGQMPGEAGLVDMIQRRSSFYDGRVEGVYVKVEKDGRVRSRGKVVRSDFIAGNEHWTRGGVRPNVLKENTSGV